MVGYEYYDEDFANDFFIAGFSPDFVTRFLNGTSLPSDIIPLSLEDPEYGQTQPGNYVGRRLSFANKQSRHGFYAINEASIGKFTVVGGIRFDSSKDEVLSFGTVDDDATTFRIGGVYKPVENISIFMQWADSYVPQAASAQDPRRGGPFEPVTGTIIEGGVKARLFEDRFFATLAVYNIKRQNIRQSTGEDPGGDGLTDFVSIGEVTSTGVELEFIGDLTPDWVLTLSYAYNDVRITEDNGSGGFGTAGDRFTNAPVHQFGFWTRYQIPSVNLAFAFGGDYVGERISLPNHRVKPYFVFDASIIWDRGDWRVLLRANNLFDKTYAESGFGLAPGSFPGEPRSVFIEISRKW